MSTLRCESCLATIQAPAIQPDGALACPHCRQPLGFGPAAVQEVAGDPGRRVGRFVVVRELGQGAVAIVQQAWDTRLNRWVAIKFLKPGVADAEVMELFRQEASVVASLDHPNIAPVYDVLDLDGRVAIVMKYIDGRTLDEIFFRERRGPAPIETAVRYLRDASLGLGFAHGRGYVHRDVKPGNLMVDGDSRVYALDFGLAKVLARSDAQRDLGVMMGTPAFMSPEQAMGLATFVDARSDVFSLGATLWTVLAGRPPFQGKTDLEVARAVVRSRASSVRTHREDVPKDLDLVLRKAMEKDHEARYPTGVELASALNDCLLSLEDSRETASGQEPIGSPGAPVKVLFIEDDPGVAGMVRGYLEKEGLDVLHFADGAEAMKQVETIEPEIVLLDVNLPGKSGWEILKRLRSLPSYNQVPIIMVTGEAGEENEVKGFQLGANDYIEKPFSLAVLRARVRRLVRRHPVRV